LAAANGTGFLLTRCGFSVEGAVKMNWKLDLSLDWLFRRGRAGKNWVSGSDNRGAMTVDLPHCWNTTDTFQIGVEYYRGPGAYLKSFRISQQSDLPVDGRWILESEGFYGTGDLWLNGRKVADIDGEYLGFCLDVGRDLVTDGENILALRLTNSCGPDVLPGIGMPDFLLYGGLAGRVFLRHEPSLHMDRGCLQIIGCDVMGDQPRVAIRSAIRNSRAVSRIASVSWNIVCPDGREIGPGAVQSCEVPADGVAVSPGLDIGISSPELWSPQTPAQYVLKGSVCVDGTVVDCVEQRFGLRSAVFSPGRGFFLNGKRTVLLGCNRHESMPGFGSALPVSIHREDVRIMKETGCNMVRLSHYPQHPAFLDACDAQGLLVCAEIASWKSVRTGRWLKNALRQLEGMIRRDRNRPSIILWCMGNESRSRKAYVALGNLAHSMDQRPTIYAENHMYRAIRAKTTGLPDVWGCNYELNVLAKAADASALKSVLVTECSNMPTACRGKLDEELKQIDILAGDLETLGKVGFNSGCLIWCLNDYATLRKKRYLRFSGIVDAWRVPKMSRSFLQAMWFDQPLIRVYADWGMRGDPIVSGHDRIRREVHVFTNCRQVALLVNGREVAAGSGRPHMVFSIEFEPGILESKGFGEGSCVEDRIQSFGRAAAIELVAERDVLPAIDRETTGISVAIRDLNRAMCLDWNGHIFVKVSGPGRLRTFMADGMVPVAGGVGRLFVSGNGQKGEAEVVAVCPPLACGSARVDFR